MAVGYTTKYICTLLFDKEVNVQVSNSKQHLTNEFNVKTNCIIFSIPTSSSTTKCNSSLLHNL